MGKNVKLADKSKKYFDIAKKIVEGLLESEFCKEEYLGHIIISSKEIRKDKFIEIIAEALKTNLTYGNLGTLTLRNNKGEIVAKLYILPDGTLADDSWLRNEGI